MIYTITLNPALDYVLTVNNFRPGQLNRSSKEEILAGGKGINVSTVLTRLGVSNTALGFVAGFTGAALEHRLAQNGISADFVHLPDGLTRINVKISGTPETEINANGPAVDDCSFNALLQKLDKLQDGDYLVLAGSIPSQMSSLTYDKILAHVCGRGIKIIMDTTGTLLWNSLRFKPFLVKPNHTELGELFGCEIDLTDERCTELVAELAARLRREGAVNVCVSMSWRGALLLDQSNDLHFISSPKGRVIHSVGAGDSMVAGFLAGYTGTKDYGYALKLGAAAGSATCFTDGLATAEQIYNVLGNME